MSGRLRSFRHRTFRVRNIENLWKDSDDEETNNLSNVEMVDLTGLSESSSSSTNSIMIVSTASDELPALSPPLPLQSSVSMQQEEKELQQQQRQQQIVASYVPRTLQSNSRRHSILPAFPASIYNLEPPLLLANVPVHQLSQEQIDCRRKSIGSLGYTTNTDNSDIPSNFRNNYQPFIGSLIVQYNVDESVVEYNLYRMSQCFNIFVNELIRRHKYDPERFILSDKQKKYALEFYLQIDVDLFFMKTCSFRRAQPRSINEGLFCINEPDAQYSLSKCNQCSLCVPRQDIDLYREPTIFFGPNQEFQFLNGYRTILNCNASCRTQNIIYVLTCPCGQFEYIGETSLKLSDRLGYHRQHFNRIIHEFLIGEENVQLTQPQPKDDQTLKKDRMLLYKHAARCPKVIQRFLKFNPKYWCFIPVPFYKFTQHNRKYDVPSSLILLDPIFPTSIGSKNRAHVRETPQRRSDEDVRSCMRHLPPVPAGYAFSTPQRLQQFQFFKAKLDAEIKQHQFLDLFNVAIIAVLPHDATKVVRQFVESLFITHTEAKLNTSGRLLQDADNNDNNSGSIYPMSKQAQIIDRGEWCRRVVLIIPNNTR